MVPAPLHITQGVNHRLLRLAVEMVTEHRSSTDRAVAGRHAGKNVTPELVELLHEMVRVRPSSLNGGHFKCLDCHTIDYRSTIL